MKKFLAMLLALVMALSLVACGSKKDDTSDTDGDNSAEPVDQSLVVLENVVDWGRPSPTVCWCRRVTPRVCWRASTRPLPS